MDHAQFHFETPVRVRNYEVDWQGIVHNANYLLYCEVGRVEYLKALGIALDLTGVNGPSKVVLVRNEINYRMSARFDEMLTVYTRVASVGNTSFVMEGLVERPSDGARIVENVAVHVWLDPAVNRPVRVPESFRELVRQQERGDCRFEPADERG